ncbi:MAG TPA: aldo/keto reductase [Polyangiaceae bacterium]|jgi:aryl-alcohol dehydrogenase-like predicted oxidoreductase|nr:aldo/keto reductase [Polyangiaceae bacterium]
MRYGRISGVDVPVSRLIQGTLHLGRQTRDEALALFDAAYELGCNAFDTAVVYAGGETESWLGSWIEQRGIRASVVIIDKGCHPAGPLARMNPAELRRDVEGSLERLRSDAIDLYLLHRDDPAVPVDEIVVALNEQLQRGAIRAFGASNWTHGRIQAAHDFASKHSLTSFAASSPGLSLVEAVRSWPGCVCLQPSRDREACAWYQATGLPLLAWSPLAGGFLSGRYQRGNLAEFSASWERRVIEFYSSEANLQRLERLTALARARAISVGQMALAYVLGTPGDVYAVLGCRDRAELESSVEALALQLTPVELAELNAIV